MPRHLDPGRPCACTSQKTFSECCRPYLRGEREAPDAAALMRSRFSAFALENAAYLRKTLHESHPDRLRPEAEVLRDLKRACRAFDYRSLDILAASGPDEAGRAHVEFRAGLVDRGRDRSFIERSSFLHDGAGWRYVSGEMRDASGEPAPAREG